MKELDDLLAGVYSATVTDAAILVREAYVKVGVLTRPVRIRIFYEGRAEAPFRFELSAEMRPDDAAENGAFPTGAISEGECLRLAVRQLTQRYEAAVRSGRMPDESWLVESGR